MTQDDRVARHVVVHGRVQGVFFRHTCRTEARSRGVTGWVTNLYDGTVEAVFEGSPAAVEAMVAWARLGPPSADVDRIDVSDTDLTGSSEFLVS